MSTPAMNTLSSRLLVIDPQNDFCDIPGAALPVAGANLDMMRLAGFVRDAGTALTDIVVTLDSHASVGIERVTFWQTADGHPVSAFTEITEALVRAGAYRPRQAALTARVLAYLAALEAAGRYKLMVWPVHCVLGTWGHNIHDAVAHELASWELTNQCSVLKVLKGLNPLTEQYSAVRAEVPDEADTATQTNILLVDRVVTSASSSGWLFVAGEASSHCVAATMLDLLALMDDAQHARTILLQDCMSPVFGCTAAADEFFATVRGQGVNVLSTAEALALLA